VLLAARPGPDPRIDLGPLDPTPQHARVDTKQLTDPPTALERRLAPMITTTLQIQAHRPFPGLLAVLPRCRHGSILLARSEPPPDPGWFKLSAELARRETRLEKLRAAKEAIEAEAKEKAKATARKKAEAARKSEEEVDAAGKRAVEEAKPKASAQRSFTDPEARMMKTSHGFCYAYNAQAVVDEKSQVILAAEVTVEASDVNQLVAMIEKTEENLAAARIGHRPGTYLADAGYCSEDNLEGIEDLGSEVLVATGRQRHGEQFPKAPRGPIPKNAARRERMARKLRTKKGRADYARRKAIVEPAFGQMKVRQDAGGLRLRGRAGAQGEWTLHAICHNLRKLMGAWDRLGLARA
jgi:hypothetical protein